MQLDRSSKPSFLFLLWTENTDKSGSKHETPALLSSMGGTFWTMD